MDVRTAKIRTLNDLARSTFLDCLVMISEGIQGREDVETILARVRTFDGFCKDNDPYGEHDFGSILAEGETIFWKMDYYDRSLVYGSADPADAEATIRVLTVMLASEY